MIMIIILIMMVIVMIMMITIMITITIIQLRWRYIFYYRSLTCALFQQASVFNRRFLKWHFRKCFSRRTNVDQSLLAAQNTYMVYFFAVSLYLYIYKYCFMFHFIVAVSRVQNIEGGTKRIFMGEMPCICPVMPFLCNVDHYAWRHRATMGICTHIF